MSVEKIKVGLICIGLEGERVDLAREFRASVQAALARRGIEILNPKDSYTLTEKEVLQQSCQCENADALIYLIGTWCLANHVINAVQEIKRPFAIWGIPEPVSFSSVGTNVVHGTLGELGIDHKLIYGFPEDEDVIEELYSFLKAAAIKKELTHLKLGVIGGKAISAYPTSADISQIKKIFGIEIEHIDQLILLKKGEKISKELCGEMIKKIKLRYGSVNVPEDMLYRSVSVYFALREIIKEQKLDMVSVKCLGEFVDHYVCCCLALSMLADEGYVCNCQCNINALISSYIMQKLSGEPCFFGDVSTVLKESGTMRLICCGGLPGKLAENDKQIQIVPQYEYMGRGRGACTFFCMKPGTVTVGTLGRNNGKYVMNIALGTAYKEAEEELLKVRSWAQGFVKLEGDPMQFYQNLRCNHSVVAYGNHKKVLLELCKLYHISPELNEKIGSVFC